LVVNRATDGPKIAYQGEIDNNHIDASLATARYVEDAVDNLMEGKPVNTTFTKAIGCTIKWRE
jgi:hypothetical protein